MKTLKFLVCLVLAASLWSCSSKGEPSEIGQILTPEQVAQLAGDDSWNGKLVAVQGYPRFAKRVVNLDRGNLLAILTEDGKELIQANVSIKDASGTTLMEFGGETSRNYASMTKEQQLHDATFTLDDYSEAPYGEFLFSGTLVYDGGKCTLTKVTIHPAR